MQAKVALDKQEHPDRFCRQPRCLWRVVKLDRETQTHSPRPDCPNVYCPRHTPRHGKDSVDALEPIRRAACTKDSTLMSALRKNGVL